MATGDHGTNDNRYVDRVEEMIRIPGYQHYTKSELQSQTESSVSVSESVHSVESSFRETAYLNGLSNGSSLSGKPDENGSDSSSNSHSIQVNSSFTKTGQTEQSIDHRETVLGHDHETVSKSNAITVAEQRSENSGNSAAHSENNVQSSIATDRELFSVEANLQPFMTVDPNEILSKNTKSKTESWSGFLDRSLKRETFSSEQSQFDKLLEEQVSSQKEKELREQMMMEKLLGTIPAYRGDWKQKGSVESVQSALLSTEVNSSRSLNQDMAFSTAASSEMKNFYVSKNEATTSNFTSPAMSSTVESEDVKLLERTVLSQGSVTPPSGLIEVERKFIPSKDSKEKLVEMGATLLSKKTFKDIYYDTSGYKLIFEDNWLRLRDKQWEFKTPVQSPESNTISSLYKEITNERDIVKELCKLLSLDSGMSQISVNELVHIGLLNDFCHLTTTRKTYGLPTCTVDLDETNFGFRVGEIEIVVMEKDRIPSALETISKVAEQLEFQPYFEANLQLSI